MQRALQSISRQFSFAFCLLIFFSCAHPPKPGHSFWFTRIEPLNNQGIHAVFHPERPLIPIGKNRSEVFSAEAIFFAMQKAGYENDFHNLNFFEYVFIL
jgi:hypothetical protein